VTVKDYYKGNFIISIGLVNHSTGYSVCALCCIEMDANFALFQLWRCSTHTTDGHLSKRSADFLFSSVFQQIGVTNTSASNNSNLMHKNTSTARNNEASHSKSGYDILS